MFSTVVMGVDSVVVSVVVVSVVVVSVGVVSVMAVSMVVSPMVSSHLPRGNTRGWWLELQHRFGKVLPHTAPQLDTPLGHKAPRSTVTSRSQPPAAPRGQDLQDHPATGARAGHTWHHRGSGRCHLGGWHRLRAQPCRSPLLLRGPCHAAGLGHRYNLLCRRAGRVGCQPVPPPLPGPAWPGCRPAQAAPGRFPSGCRGSRRHWRRARGPDGSPRHTCIPTCEPRAQPAPAGPGTARLPGPGRSFRTTRLRRSPGHHKVPRS